MDSGRFVRIRLLGEAARRDVTRSEAMRVRPAVSSCRSTRGGGRSRDRPGASQGSKYRRVPNSVPDVGNRTEERISRDALLHAALELPEADRAIIAAERSLNADLLERTEKRVIWSEAPVIEVRFQ